MRVISGVARGIRLTTPRGTVTRPTSDRVKEALFSILDSRDAVSGGQVLDLCAGSGALGIEALSRGACHAIFVEKGRTALEALRRNLSQTRFDSQATVYSEDCRQKLHELQRQSRRFDLILFDPPYAAEWYGQVLAQAAELLTPDGILVAETAARMHLAEQVGAGRCIDRRRYGDTALVFYSLEAADAP